MAWYDDLISWGVDQVSDIGISDVADLLQTGGAITGAFSTPEQKAQATAGLGAQPQYIQDFYENVYFPRVQEYAAQPFQGRPMRQAPLTTDPNFDPVFGAYGLADFQDYLNTQNTPTLPPTVPAQEVPSIPPQALPQEMPLGLPGWSDITETYVTPYGVTIQGEEGRKAAEAQGIRANFERAMQDQGRSMKGSHWVAPALADTADQRVNPFTGQTFDRVGALEALGRGDLGEVYNQAGTAVYDPTPSFLNKIAPLIASGLIAGPAALGAMGTGAIAAGAGANITGLTGLPALMAGEQAALLGAANSGLGYL